DCRPRGSRPRTTALRVGLRDRNDADPRHACSAAGWLDAVRRPQRPAHRAPRPFAHRTAINAARLRGGDMVASDRLSRARAAAAGVPDPEIPALTIDDLGMLCDVQLLGDTVQVDITPSYLGCPATLP